MTFDLFIENEPSGGPKGARSATIFHQDVSNQFVFRFVKVCSTLVCLRPVSLNRKILQWTLSILIEQYFEKLNVWANCFCHQEDFKMFLLWCVKHFDVFIFWCSFGIYSYLFSSETWFLFVFRFVKWAEIFDYGSVPSAFFFEFKNFTVDVSE